MNNLKNYWTLTVLNLNALATLNLQCLIQLNVNFSSTVNNKNLQQNVSWMKTKHMFSCFKLFIHEYFCVLWTWTWNSTKICEYFYIHMYANIPHIMVSDVCVIFKSRTCDKISNTGLHTTSIQSVPTLIT
jgi:hypothetical protein